MVAQQGQAITAYREQLANAWLCLRNSTEVRTSASEPTRHLPARFHQMPLPPHSTNGKGARMGHGCLG
ncbi:uncharacterized [Tachysurus ichikawai]